MKKKMRRKREMKRKWTSEEEAALRAGVLKHGLGWWKDILRDSEFNPILSNRSNIDLKDKWRGMSAAGDQGGRGKKSRMRKPKAANSDGLCPAAQLPTAQTSTAGAPVAREVDDSSKGLLFIKNISQFDGKIFEVFSTLKEQNVLDTDTIASYIETQNCSKMKSDSLLGAKLFTDSPLGKLQKNVGYVKSSDPVEEAAVAPAYRIAPSRHCSINYIGETNIRSCEKDDDDYCNELPDEILVLILCFMSTKEAIRMSLVSRRWKNLWMKVPKLEFCCWHETLREVFRPPNFKMYECVNLVNQVMKLHNTTTLEELTIRFPLNSKYSGDINRWIEFAARKQVKKLELDFCMISSACTIASYGNFLASPAASRLYWLKDLYLRGINVNGEAFKCLFSNSPFIERISVVDSQKLGCVVIADAPNLKYLKLSHCNFLFRLDISAPNLKIIKLHLFNCLPIANISAPILSRVSIGFYHTIGAFSSEPSWRIPGISKCMQNLLGQFSHVNKILSLIVSRDVWLGICEFIDVSHLLPELSNVEHLKVSIRKPFLLWHRYVNGPQAHKWVNGHLWPCAVVERAPFLHKLSIKLFHLDYKLRKRNMNAKWMDEDILEKVKALTNVNGQYSHQHLKVVELVGFTGCVNEVELALYLVEIAPSLEKITIDVCKLNCCWIGEDIVRFIKNEYGKFCRRCAEVLKTMIRPEIDVEIF